MIIVRRLVLSRLHFLFRSGFIGGVALLWILLVSCSGDTSKKTTQQGVVDSNDLLAQIQKRGTIIVSTDPNYAPQSYVNEDGEYAGFDIDVAQEIGKRLGVEVEFVTPDWDLIVAGNWSDRWEMSVGSVAITKKRQQLLDFATPPYYYTLAQFAATNNTGIENMDQIAGQKVCVCTETVYEYWLSGEEERLGLPEDSVFALPPSDVKIMPMKTDNECVQSIQSGREEFAIFLSSHTIVDAAIDNGVPIHKVGKPVFAEHLAVAFDKKGSKDNSQLVQRVSGIISGMRTDGTLTELSIQHFDGRDYTKRP